MHALPDSEDKLASAVAVQWFCVWGLTGWEFLFWGS